MEFTQDVGDVVSADVQLLGVNQADYSSLISDVGYHAPSRMATITLASPLGIDKLLLIVKDSVTDSAATWCA